MLLIVSMLTVDSEGFPAFDRLSESDLTVLLTDLRTALSFFGVEVIIQWETTDAKKLIITTELLTRLFDDEIDMPHFYRAYLRIQQSLYVTEAIFNKASIVANEQER